MTTVKTRSNMREADDGVLRATKQLPIDGNPTGIRADRTVPDLSTDGTFPLTAPSGVNYKGQGTTLKSLALKALGEGTQALLAAYAIYDIWEQIQSIPRDDPDWHEKATRLVSEAIASYGLPLVGMYLGALVGGVISGGPAGIPAAVAGLGAGVIADLYLGDSAKDMADRLVDQLFGKTAQTRRSADTMDESLSAFAMPRFKSSLAAMLEADTPMNPKLAALLKELGKPADAPFSVATLRKILRSPGTRRAAVVAGLLALLSPTATEEHDTNSLGDQAYRFARALGYDSDQSERFAAAVLAKGPDSAEAMAVTGAAPSDTGIEIYTPKPGEFPPMPGDRDDQPQGDQSKSDAAKADSPISPWPGRDPNSDTPTSVSPSDSGNLKASGSSTGSDVATPQTDFPSAADVDRWLGKPSDSAAKAAGTPLDAYEPKDTAADDSEPDIGNLYPDRHAPSDSDWTQATPPPAVPYDPSKSLDQNLQAMYPDLYPSDRDSDQQGDSRDAQDTQPTTAPDLPSLPKDSGSTSSDQPGSDVSMPDLPATSSSQSSGGKDSGLGSSPAAMPGTGHSDGRGQGTGSRGSEPNYDDLTFKQAFARARERARELDPSDAGKYTFTWRGKKYQTNYKGSGTDSRPEEPYIPLSRQKGMMSTTPIPNPYENPDQFGGKKRKKMAESDSLTDIMRRIMDAMDGKG